MKYSTVYMNDTRFNQNDKSRELNFQDTYISS